MGRLWLQWVKKTELEGGEKCITTDSGYQSQGAGGRRGIDNMHIDFTHTGGERPFLLPQWVITIRLAPRNQRRCQLKA